jgi:hypothetical protein
VKTGTNLTESSKQGYGSKSSVLPIIRMRRSADVTVKKQITQQVKTFHEMRLSNL